MKRILYKILARLGFRIPYEKYIPPKQFWDWVLISHVDCSGRGIRGLSIADYAYGDYSHAEGYSTTAFGDGAYAEGNKTLVTYTEKWHIDSDSKTFHIKNDCVVTHWHKLPGERLIKSGKCRECLTK